MNKNDFFGFTQLTDLTLSFNQIEHLEFDCFNTFVNLLIPRILKLLKCPDNIKHLFILLPVVSPSYIRVYEDILQKCVNKSNTIVTHGSIAKLYTIN